MTDPLKLRPMSSSPSTSSHCRSALSCRLIDGQARSGPSRPRSFCFVGFDRRSGVQGFTVPRASPMSRIRCAVGRRHHRRRDDEVAANLRSREKPRGTEKLPFRRNRREGSDDSVVISLDMDELKHRAADAAIAAQEAVERSAAVAREAAERSVDRAVDFARAAVHDSREVWRDLSTSIRVQKDNHLTISVKRSSIEFAARAVLGSIILYGFARLLLNAARGYRWGWGDELGSTRVVRDRSLAGKEVPLNKGSRLRDGGPAKKAAKFTRASRGPLDIPLADSRSEKELVKQANARGEGAPPARKAAQLPGWWPGPDLPPSTSIARRQRAEEDALRLVKGIMQKRTSGLDFVAEDIKQLRHLCKASGAKVKFDTLNARDSFYRAAIEVVLSACQGAGEWSVVDFGSEGGRGFIAGLADNIGLESGRAATMVNAAVASRTRSSLLQARALHMQSMLNESREELSKLIRLHACFPPDANSAEMEMVARGLGSHFDNQGRLEVLRLYEDLGGSETKRAAEEALGLYFRQAD